MTLRVILLLTSMLIGATPSAAQEPATAILIIREHRFEPTELRVPAGKPILLTVRNEDPTAEEFESRALKIEKIIPGGQSITVRLRPLAPGRFPFFGEYHPETAQGAVISE